MTEKRTVLGAATTAALIIVSHVALWRRSVPIELRYTSGLGAIVVGVGIGYGRTATRPLVVMGSVAAVATMATRIYRQWEATYGTT